MPLLYYWRRDNYEHDLDFGVGFHLNQKSARLHQIELGDTLWAFTRRRDGAYVLAMRLVVRARTHNRAGYRYGPYRVWGDLQRSRYFLLDGQPPLDPLIRALSLRVQAGVIGQAFQGGAAVRSITAADHAVLEAHATALLPEPRARLIPEERFEALAVAGDREAVARLVHDEGPGLAAERRSYLYETSVSRVRKFTEALRERYQDRCQLCSWCGREHYRHALCEAHHIQWISRGGQDALENLVLLCPNHHRAVHAGDAVLDFADLAFVFEEGRRERLREPGHLVG